jgi:hypothetical protein
VLRRASQGLFQEPFERLVNGFFGKLYYYAVNHRIIVTELVSVGWTDQGKKLCEAFGMDQTGNDKDGHPVYWVDLRAGNLKLARALAPSIRKLSEAYKRVAETEE